MRKTLTLSAVGLLYVTLFLAMAIRVLPVYAAGAAGSAAWLTPFIGYGVLAVLLGLLETVHRGDRFDLIQTTRQLLGPLAVPILALYALWCFFLAGVYVRYYTIQILSTIAPAGREWILAAGIAAFAALAMAGGTPALSRMNGLIFGVVAAVVVLMLAGIAPRADWQTLTSLTWEQTGGVLRGGLLTSGIWVYILPVLLAAPVACRGQRLTRLLAGRGLLLLALSLGLTGILTAALSPDLLSRLTLPLITAVKHVQLGSLLQKAVTPLIAAWILADVMTVCLFSAACLGTVQELTRLPSLRPILPAYGSAVAALALCLADGQYQLFDLSGAFILPLNLAMGLALPALLAAAAGLRRLSGKTDKKRTAPA